MPGPENGFQLEMAMLPGGTVQEATQLNIESLWSGGPFADPSYNGGNKQPSERAAMAQLMQNIRQTIFESPTGDIGACVQHVQTNASTLPNLAFAFTAGLEPGLPAPNITCLSQSSMLVSGVVSDSPPGMAYALIFNTFAASSNAVLQCIQQPVASGSPPNATLHILSPSNNKEAWITWVGDTEYDINAGDAAHNFSFRGESPVTKLLPSHSSEPFSDYAKLLKQHVTDIEGVLQTPFALDLGQVPDFDTPTDVLKSQYTIDGPISNAYLDWLTFNYARYLLASSSRGVLPANLQGKWGNDVGNAWGSDSNINLQMNYWIAEMTGLSDLTLPLFDYIERTWAPRGVQTAQVLYNISRGWVTHDEMNIFGHTGMKSGPDYVEWAADYPEAAVWMMIHVWDHFDHTNNVTWWRNQGWPLIKGVASFQLDKLIPDEHFNDSTLVVNPCNSPEQPPITLGCAHAQQIIWQLFNAVEKGFAASGDTDTQFLDEVRATREKMDKGLKIGSWGQLQEWKVEKDSPTDTHRHLSHLVGLYPGYAIINFDPSVQGNGPAKGYQKDDIMTAATVSLVHRGNGTGPDADAGWEKAWRAAAWAQLANSSTFYHELSFALYENFGQNLFSLYDPADADPIFQIDANFGFPAAVLNALLQAPDVASITTPLVVTILPALPSQWANGSIRGARIRGGITVDVQWSKSKPTSVTLEVDSGPNIRTRPVQIVYNKRVLTAFNTTPGLKKVINAF
ncbi:putative alpha-fucosidase A [Psilocybe cubensis]|uniref:Alpha-fucosidase A n=1 Tax=Psilocybe cubensis TaxID=181762 RepID=A0ACB8GLM1_PSICU|nr:putative alpha-fucosidase A [Psilocybe cubensis]KAH9475954.1 putative alpha-fucosidase A [Psilocybe cubensis]